MVGVTGLDWVLTALAIVVLVGICAIVALILLLRFLCDLRVHDFDTTSPLLRAFGASIRSRAERPPSRAKA